MFIFLIAHIESVIVSGSGCSKSLGCYDVYDEYAVIARECAEVARSKNHVLCLRAIDNLEKRRKLRLQIIRSQHLKNMRRARELVRIEREKENQRLQEQKRMDYHKFLEFQERFFQSYVNGPRTLRFKRTTQIFFFEVVDNEAFSCWMTYNFIHEKCKNIIFRNELIHEIFYDSEHLYRKWHTELQKKIDRYSVS